MSSAPIVDRIRIIPRPNDFLDRNVGSSGEVFFDAETSSLRLYSGKLAGGFEVLTNKSLSGVASKTYDVTVVGPQGDDVGNKYVLNGVYKPELSFVIGYTYIFNQNDQTNVYYPNQEGGTNNQHPLNFSSDNINGELGGGTAYTDNVTYKLDYRVVSKQAYWDGFERAKQRSVSIIITDQTPSTLYYWCQNHLNMGNSITTNDPGTGSGGSSTEISDDAPSSPSHGDIWYNSANGRLYVYVVDTDSGQWVQPGVPVPASLLDLGISDGTDGQVLTTDGAGNFSFTSVGGDTIGNFTLSNSVIDTDDSSGISFVPAVTMNSDLTVENDIIVSNKVSATSFINTGTGTASIDSATTLTLRAPDGITVDGDLITNGNGIIRSTSSGDSGQISLGTDTADNDLMVVRLGPIGRDWFGVNRQGNAYIGIPVDNEVSNLGSLNIMASTPAISMVALDPESGGYALATTPETNIRLTNGSNLEFMVDRFNDETTPGNAGVRFVIQGAVAPYAMVISDNQNVGINVNSPNADSALEVATKPILFPRLTTTERDALTGVNGMVIYNSTDNRFQGYQNGAWINIDDGTAA